MKNKTNKRGFTLVEMMVVVALLSIVSVMLYQAWHYIYSTHKRAEMQYIQQNAANQVAEWIEANIYTATHVEITQKVDSVKDPDYMYIYSSDPDNYETSTIDYWYYDDTTHRAVTGTLTDVPLELSFNTMDTTAADYISKAVEFSVSSRKWDFDSGYSATDYSYVSDSFVSFPNMARAVKAQKTGDYVDSTGAVAGLFSDSTYSGVGGASIKFKTGVNLLSDINISLEGCFVATAAYGSKNDVTVATLRMFRDEILLSNPVGSAFVDFYYRVSPPIADAIAQSPTARLVVRTALTPLVLIATLMLQPMWLVVTFVTLIYLYIIKFFILPKKSLHLR